MSEIFAEVALGPLYPNLDAQKGTWLNASGTTTGDYFALIDESPDTPVDTDFIRGAANGNNNATQTYIAGITDMPANFRAMNSLSFNVRYRSTNILNDNLGFTLKITNAAGTADFTNIAAYSNISILAYTNTGSVPFTLTTAGINATKTDWDNARLVIAQTNIPNPPNDGAFISISAIEFYGNYSTFSTYIRSGSSSGVGSGSATGARLRTSSATSNGVGSSSVSSRYIRVRTATSSASGSSSASRLVTKTRTASGSGVSGSIVVNSNDYFYREITVDSSGYYFYEYLNFVLIEPQFSSSFNVAVTENANMQMSASFESDFNVESSISIDNIISAGISISFNTDVSISTNLIIDIYPEEIMTLVSVISSSFEVLRSGGGEDTSDIKAFFILDDTPLTEHNRTASISAQTLNVNSSNWRGKKSVYYKIQPSKRVFTIQWTFVPGKRENTVDLNAGRDYIRQKSIDPSDHVLKIRNLDTNGINPHTTEVYNVLVAEYNETLVRRDLVGDDYYWDCTLSLKEV